MSAKCSRPMATRQSQRSRVASEGYAARYIAASTSGERECGGRAPLFSTPTKRNVTQRRERRLQGAGSSARDSTAASSTPHDPTPEAALEVLVNLQRRERAFVEHLFVFREEAHERDHLVVEENHLRQLLLDLQFTEAQAMEEEWDHQQRLDRLQEDFEGGCGWAVEELRGRLVEEHRDAEAAASAATALRQQLVAHDGERQRLCDLEREGLEAERVDTFVRLSELEHRHEVLVRENKEELIVQNFCPSGPAASFSAANCSSRHLRPNANRPRSPQTCAAAVPKLKAEIIGDVADVVTRSNLALASVANILAGKLDASLLGGELPEDAAPPL